MGVVWVSAAALALVAACGKGGDSGKGPVVLKVNDKSYTATQVETALAQEGQRLPPQVQQHLTTKEGQKQFLDRLVRRELLAQEAERQKIAEQPEVAEQLKAFREEVMLRTLVQKEVGAKVGVEDKEVEDYFRANADEFSGDKIRARHILVESEDEAQKVMDRLATKKETFEEVAKSVSRDTFSAQKGGDLDYMGREQMIPEFAKAAFALKVGEVSGPVRTPFGVHLIKLVDRRKGQPMPFDQVKDQLKRRMLEERQGERFQAWMKQLETAAKITREDSYLPVGTPFAAPGPAAPVAPPAGIKGGGQS
jgi:peptidyl-prolyl cis-trans isomerase C